MPKNSELFEVIAAWQQTKLPVTLTALDGVYPSMSYPGATGAPFIRAAVSVDGSSVFEATIAPPGTISGAKEWLEQVATTMALPKPGSGWRDPLSVTTAHAGWYEEREKEAQIGLLDKGVDPVVVLRATQYPREVGWAAIARMTQHQVDSLLRGDLSAEDSRWYGRSLGKAAVEFGKNSTWETDERYLYRSRYPEVREGAMSVANKERATYALSDLETEVVRSATARLAELGEQAMVDAIALDENRSPWERLPAITRSSRETAVRLSKSPEWEIAASARRQLFSLLGEEGARASFAPLAKDLVIHQNPSGKYEVRVSAVIGGKTLRFREAMPAAQAAVAIKACGHGLSCVAGDITITGPGGKKAGISGLGGQFRVWGGAVSQDNLYRLEDTCPYTYKIHGFSLSEDVVWPWWMGTVPAAESMVQQILLNLNS